MLWTACRDQISCPASNQVMVITLNGLYIFPEILSFIVILVLSPIILLRFYY